MKKEENSSVLNFPNEFKIIMEKKVSDNYTDNNPIINIDEEAKCDIKEGKEEKNVTYLGEKRQSSNSDNKINDTQKITKEDSKYNTKGSRTFSEEKLLEIINSLKKVISILENDGDVGEKK